MNGRLTQQHNTLKAIGMSLFYSDGHEVMILRGDEIIAQKTLKNCNNDDQVADFINETLSDVPS